MRKRYEAIEIDGQWLVLDHSHPEAAPAICQDEAQAKMNAHVWSMLTQYDPLVVGPDRAWGGGL